MLTITPIYAGLAGLIFFAISLRVSLRRLTSQVSIGAGEDKELTQRIRIHGNFAEYVPMILILMALAEFQGMPPLATHLAGVVMIAGRLAHLTGMKTARTGPARRFAAVSTYLLILLLSLGTLLHAVI